MRSFVRIIITCLLIYCLAHAPAYGVAGYSVLQDSTSPGASLSKDSSAPGINLPVRRSKADTIIMERENIYPYSSLQQLLKGNAAGVYIQEPSGEPGSNMSMFIRGTAIPMLSSRDIYEAQPTVILDGIPMIMDHPFAFDIQLFDYNRIGPATNILASIDPDNIASIEVVKDFGRAAMYGPRAANGGVILLTTKAPVMGRRRISFNTWIGIAQKPSVFTTNAKFENDFRQPFYDKYANADQQQTYPLYLRDSTNDAYYGPSNWTDLYYRNRMTYGVNASLSSGTERANFMFAVGNRKTTNPADATCLDRYNAMFEINMVPVRGLTISAMINGTRLERTRNTFLRDRFAEMQYLPDLSNPLPPNKEYYSKFRNEYTKSFDENKLNEVNGYFKFNIRFSDKLHFNSSFGFDYNEGLRDLFYPSTLMETVNYVSNYFGYNQRVFFDNSLTFDHQWNKDHHITIEAGESFQSDYSRYNYAYAYKGPNDLIRVNLLSSADNDSKNRPKSFRHELTYMFLDQQRHRLLSFYGRGAYSYKDLLDFSVLLRADGSSSAQPDNWWMFAPTFSAGLNAKSLWLADEPFIDRLRLHASWGRVGRLLPDDRFGEGPQYTSDLSFSNNPVRFSYNAFPGMSRAYSSGYIGYGIKWPYTDQLELGADVTILQDRLNLSFALYDRVDKNMILGIPFASEYGYNIQYKNGMKVRNRGLDAAAQYAVLPAGKVQWSIGANVNLNRNKLLALPDGLQSLVVANGTKRLYVGRAIDQYWVLENNGIYNRDADVPVNPSNGKPLNYKGIPLVAGDPKWKDHNGDFVIDDADKTLTGNALPIIVGGFNTDVTWRGFTLGMAFYYNWGRKIMNHEMATRLDFINHEGKIDMSAVKEITFWTKAGNYEQYPQYNPWSTVIPYRNDQDLFMENGNFLKLRTLSLQYDMTKAPWWKKNGNLYRLTLYGTVNNLFTLTPYTGGDPELVDYNGFDNGYGLPIPRSYTIGLKMEL